MLINGERPNGPSMSGRPFRVPYLNGKIRKGVWVIWLIVAIVQIPEGLFYDDDVFLANFIVFCILVVITLWYQFELYMGHGAGWLSWLLKDDRIEEPKEETPIIRSSGTQTHITNITLNDSVYIADKEE